MKISAAKYQKAKNLGKNLLATYEQVISQRRYALREVKRAISSARKQAVLQRREVAAAEKQFLEFVSGICGPDARGTPWEDLYRIAEELIVEDPDDDVPEDEDIEKMIGQIPDEDIVETFTDDLEEVPASWSDDDPWGVVASTYKKMG
jgi:hypothetical protein